MKRSLSLLLALLMLLSCFSGMVLAADKAAEPAVIRTSADATSDAAVIENPTGVKIWEPRKLTDAERATLLQDIALAYHYQSNEASHIQYDGRRVSKVANLARHDDDGRPEDAWFDSTVYSVCSNYCWKIYHEAYNHPLFRMTYARTRTWCDFPEGTPEVVYQYQGPDSELAKGETNLDKAVAESRKVVQAGDIICYGNTDGGHAMMFVGDLFGDGTDYILHCKGASYDQDTGLDQRENPAQCIELMKADKTAWGGASASWSLNRPDTVAKGFAILRPALDPALPELPTAESMARLQFRRMKITRELDRYKFAGAMTGEEIPVYLTVENKGADVLTEVPVEEYIPEGTALVEGSQTKGAKIEGNTIKWAVKIPAGKSITLTYKVKVTAKLGETVNFKGGLVGGIASRSTSLRVGGKGLTEAQNTAIYDHGMSLKSRTSVYQDMNFFNRFYADCLGVNIGLPKTTAELLKNLTEVKGNAVRRTKNHQLDKMILPLHFTGQYAHATNEWEQVREYKEEYYKPGDIFVCLGGESTTKVKENKDVELMIYLGNKKVLVHDSEEGTRTKSFNNSVGRTIKDNLLIALRPTQAYQDINACVPEKLTFTDVTEADWYYSYVATLVQDGVVSGMTATTFAPKGNLTYGQALKLIAVGLGYGEQAATADHWAGGYLALAQKEGWLTGNINLDGNVSRIAFCRIAAKAKGLTVQPASNPFKDTANTSVLALVNAGIINGMTADTFQPNGLLTRAQISKIIALLMEV